MSPFYDFKQYLALKMSKQYGYLILPAMFTIQEWGYDATLGKRYVNVLYKGESLTYLYTPIDINTLADSIFTTVANTVGDLTDDAIISFVQARFPLPVSGYSVTRVSNYITLVNSTDPLYSGGIVLYRNTGVTPPDHHHILDVDGKDYGTSPRTITGGLFDTYLGKQWMRPSGVAGLLLPYVIDMTKCSILAEIVIQSVGGSTYDDVYLFSPSGSGYVAPTWVDNKLSLRGITGSVYNYDLRAPITYGALSKPYTQDTYINATKIAGTNTWSPADAYGWYAQWQRIGWQPSGNRHTMRIRNLTVWNKILTDAEFLTMKAAITG